MTIEEIEKILEERKKVHANPKLYTSEWEIVLCEAVRDLIAQVREARKQASEEAAEIADEWSQYVVEDTAPCTIEKYLRRKAEEDIGNSGRVDDNDPNDISV